MPIREAHKSWTFTSTGSGEWLDASQVREASFYVNTAAASTATVLIQTAADSTSFAVQLGSAVNLGASSGVLVQFTGPFGVVRPRVTDNSGTVTVVLWGN